MLTESILRDVVDLNDFPKSCAQLLCFQNIKHTNIALN